MNQTHAGSSSDPRQQVEGQQGVLQWMHNSNSSVTADTLVRAVHAMLADLKPQGVVPQDLRQEAPSKDTG